MKSFLVLCFSLLITISQAYADSGKGKVTRINLYGGEWGNSWKGGMLYKLDNTPSGVTYFTVHQGDIAFENFLSMLLTAKHTKTSISVTYSSGSIDNNGYVNTLAISED